MGAMGSLLLLTAISLVLGMVLVVLSLLCFKPKQRDALSYVPAKGVVKGAEVVERHEGGTTVYAPVIEWECEVTGVRYGVKGYGLYEVTGPREWAEDVVSRYPVGAEVTVYHDPDHPHQCVLDTSSGPTPGLCLGAFQILGFVALGAGVVMAIAAVLIYFVGRPTP